MLWSVVPAEVVFAESEAILPYEEIEYHGVKMLVEKISPIESRIVRILSTEPNDYLSTDIQPGAVLFYTPVAESI